MNSDTVAVRAGEELNTPALRDYLRTALPHAVALSEVRQFPGGHSNLTYLLRLGAAEYVLRRGPLGPVAAKAHDMARECRLLAALHPHYNLAPRVEHLCADASVIGGTFFLMERRHGVVLRDPLPPGLFTQPDSGEQVSKAVLDGLVRLHAVNAEATGLQALGQPEGFLLRQVNGWSGRWQRAQTDAVPEIPPLLKWLHARLPMSPPPTVVHNDYKPDNVMLDAAHPACLTAVLDWEMATVGDPLLDLGILLVYWSQPADPAGDTPAVTARPGWWDRGRLLQEYAAATGRDVSCIRYYEVFALFKLAVILQQIYVRWANGQTQDHRFRCFGQRARRLIQQAATAAEE